MSPPVPIIAAVAFLLTAPNSAIFGQAESEIPVVTVGEAFKDLAGYNGKSIVIVGRYAGTMEGAWLSEECERNIETGVQGQKNLISLRTNPSLKLRKDFKWDVKVLSTKLKQVQKTTKLQVAKQYNYSDKWAAIFGRFETGRQSGYGHLNAASGQLVSPEGGYHELAEK